MVGGEDVMLYTVEDVVFPLVEVKNVEKMRVRDADIGDSTVTLPGIVSTQANVMNPQAILTKSMQHLRTCWMDTRRDVFGSNRMEGE